MTVHIHSRIEAIDFAASEIDAAISVGTHELPGLVSHRLQAEQLVVILGAEGPHTLGTLAPERIASQTLLSVASNPNAWAEWFSYHGLPHRSMRLGPRFELTSHLIQAVHAGIGIGLVPRVLVEDELASGELATDGQPVFSKRSYYLVYPQRNEALPSLRAFRQWLLAQI